MKFDPGFIDQPHKYWKRYHDCLDQWGEVAPSRIITKLDRLIELDPNYLDPYNLKADILEERERFPESEAVIATAYGRAIAIISSPNGDWPKLMHWGCMENRHIMRALEKYGRLCWKRGESETALGIFRKMLSMNLMDNQGMRFYILALRMGLSHAEYFSQLENDHETTETWLNMFPKYMKDYPEEFKAWIAFAKSLRGGWG